MLCVRRRAVGGFVAVALLFGIPVAAGGDAAAAAGSTLGGSTPGGSSPSPSRSLEIFYTSPMLVRAGERVRMPVQVVCATPDGRPCDASVTLGLRVGHEPWRLIGTEAVPDLQFDLTAPARRAVAEGASSGWVDFFLRATDTAGRTATLPPGAQEAPLRFYVTRRMRVLRVPALPFGHVKRGSTRLFVRWGSGPARAGLQLGPESATIGPSAFDVDRQGGIHIVDALQHRLAVFRSGRLLREAGLPTAGPAALAIDSADVDRIAASSNGGAEASSVPLAGAPARRSALGQGWASQVRALGRSAYALMLPMDAWVKLPAGTDSAGADTAGAQEGVSAGRPLPGGAQLIRIASTDRVRVAIVRGGRVVGATEIRSDQRFGDIPLAEPDGGGGYLLVVHTSRAGSNPADHYQVLHVGDGGALLGTFAVSSHSFALVPPLSRFKLGPDGQLYQMTSGPRGVRILRYQIEEDR